MIDLEVILINQSNSTWHVHTVLVVCFAFVTGVSAKQYPTMVCVCEHLTKFTNFYVCSLSILTCFAFSNPAFLVPHFPIVHFRSPPHRPGTT